MGARRKLNSANILGVLLAAAAAGWLTGSVAVAVGVAAALTAAALNNGDIR